MLKSDKRILSELNQIPVRELITIQREHGRRHLASADTTAVSFRGDWDQRHKYALHLLEDEGRSRLIRQVASLLKEITSAIHAMSGDRELKVTYYSYTDVNVIDWFLQPFHSPFAVLKKRALHGVLAILRDLARFETESRTGIEKRRAKMSVDVVDVRVERITEAIAACQSLFGAADVDFSTLALPVQYDSLEQYVTEETHVSALVNLTAFPRTRFHDEIVFLRTIHLGELCFFALRIMAMEAIENLRRRRLAVAAQCMSDAANVGKLLHRIFAVLNTMPKEHFLDFREYTEEASAVQSRGYQLFDIYYRGVDPRKVTIYRDHQSLNDLRHFNHPSFLSLKRAVHDRTLTELPGWTEVEAAARRLDRFLKTWRGLHVAFASKYLERSTKATGGTSGAPYLLQFLEEGLFSDTPVDLRLLRDLGTDEDLIEWIPLTPGSSIAPPVGRRAATTDGE